MALPSVPGFFHRAGHELVSALHAAAPVLLDETGVIIYGHGRKAAAALNVGRGHREFGELVERFL